MTIIESLYHYLDACPLLQDGMLYVDYLGPDPVSYVIDAEPATAIVKRYANGDTVRQYLFTLGTRDYYSQDVMERIDSSGFFEEFSDWLDAQNIHGNLPSYLRAKKSNPSAHCPPDTYMMKKPTLPVIKSNAG